MKLAVLVVVAPLALTACNNLANPFGGKSASTTSNNMVAAVPVVPDAVIVNGVTYVREGGPGSAPAVPAPASTDPAAITPAPDATPAAEATDTPPPPSGQPEGVTVRGGH